MSEEFESEIFRINKQLCEFSNNGKLLAIAFQNTLTIKKVYDYSIFHSFVFSDVIEYIEWARNNAYIICANITNAIIQIFSLMNPDWKYKLTIGSSGFESVTWSPDFKNILTVSDYKVHITVWPLINTNVTNITKLKSTKYGTAFSPNAKYLAVIIKDDCNEYIELYKTEEWKLSRKIMCNSLQSIDGISWSPNSEILCIWCSISGASKLILYSNNLESDVGLFNPDDNKGTENNDSEIPIKGIEFVKWMPSGQILAVAGHNEVVVLLNYITWKPIRQLSLQPVLKENNHLSKVYKESIIKTKDKNNKNVPPKHILEEINYGSINVPISKKNPNQPTVSILDICEFSSSGQYLTVRHQIYPNVLWIWDFTTNIVDSFFLENEISAIRWDLKQPTLYIFTESSCVFKWTPENASCVTVPNGMCILDGRCHLSSELILLCGYNKAIVYNIDKLFN